MPEDFQSHGRRPGPTYREAILHASDADKYLLELLRVVISGLLNSILSLCGHKNEEEEDQAAFSGNV